MPQLKGGKGRYLSLPDRLAVVADGLHAGLTLTVIATGIGKHTSTVVSSRNPAAPTYDGLYPVFG